MKSIYVFLLGLGIVLLSDFIGKRSIAIGSISIVVLPMLYAVIFGLMMTKGCLGALIKPINKILTDKNVAFAGKLSGYALLILGVRLGFSIGPNVTKIFDVGLAFIAQELAHFFVPVIAMPFAMLLGLKRECIGCATSISREGAVGIITEKYGVNSSEGVSVVAVYMIGTVIGTIIFSVLGSVAIYSGLHPYALAMACGVGSASMMTAASTALASQVPVEMQDTVMTYAGTSNLISTGVTGIYLLLFCTLPFANWYYAKLYPLFFKNK